MKTNQLKYLTIFSITTLLAGLFACKSSNVSVTQKSKEIIVQASSDKQSSIVTKQQGIASNSSTDKAFAQTKTVRPILRRNSENKLSFIAFPNGKVFDLYASNPYNKLNYKLVNKKYEGNNMYEVDNLSVKDIIPNFNPGVYLNGQTKNTKVKLVTSMCGLSYSSDSAINIAAFQLMAFDSSYLLLGVNSTFWFFDTNGTITHKLENQDVNFQQFKVTCDGNYLFYSHGWSDDMTPIVKSGFRIIDLSDHHLLYNSNSFNLGINAIGNYFIETISDDENQLFTLNIFEPKTKKIFKKQFTRIELGQTNHIINNGLEVVMDNGDKVFYSFYKDFITEEMK